MATSELRSTDVVPARQLAADETWDIGRVAVAILSALASLRLTVVLFAAAIFLIFVGTLAQVDHDVWDVVRHGYFHVWFAWVEFQCFERLVQMFFPIDGGWQGGFYFPGGRLIGIALFLNLITAHSIRFKIAASGMRLWLGAAVIAFGIATTWLVIYTGMDEAIESDLSSQFASTVWHGVRAAVAGLALTGAYLLVLSYGRVRRPEWIILLAIDLVVAALAVWLFLNPEARLDNSGLRILWQLIKGGAAGGALLAGCILVFRKRAGIVLLHGGVALLMFGEFWTDWQAQESQMTIAENQSANYSSDIRAVELAIVDPADPKLDHVTVVAESLLKDNVGNATAIVHDYLPFSIRVREWLPNSRLAAAGQADNPATAGQGRSIVADAAPPVSGLDSKDVDRPSAYVEFFDKAGGQSLGTYLVSQMLPEQSIEVGGKSYNVELRFERIYYPHSLLLRDFRFDRYVGTQTAKNYSSLVLLQDPEQKIKRDFLISMNNPLRYAGSTYYQSSFDPETEQITVLQVVTNSGWMIPYVACMLVATGMLAHFSLTLARFIRRRQEAAELADNRTEAFGAGQSWGRWLLANCFPITIVLLAAAMLASKTRIPSIPAAEPQIYEFAQLPLVYEGRVKPYDTLALNALQILSGRQKLLIPQTDGREKSLPAIRWLLDLIAGVPKADAHRVFRIENLDVLQTLKLEPRHGFKYALDEFRESLTSGRLDAQVNLAVQVPEKERSLYQKKIMELAHKLQLYGLLKQSFMSPRIADTPEGLRESLQTVQDDILRLRTNSAPHAVPPVEADGDWKTLMEAEFELLLSRVTNRPTNPATQALSAMLAAYDKGDGREFNAQLARYRETLADYQAKLDARRDELVAEGMAKAELLDQRKVEFETFFNRMSPFFNCMLLYLAALFLVMLSWLGWSRPLVRASTWLLYLAFILHTLALIGRIYISGRPPVTNLYSSAVFVGWAGVLIALVFESLYRLGFGNVVAAIIGFATLLVAFNLSLDGDTLIVLQAVLDTQFWLATHVVTVNMGYSTTYLAGILGVLYVLFAYQFPVLSDEQRQQLTRMTYGTLCFAIFFSFVGTVLGGLWADDSWGRFWGWDPKENGALMIVLWNALVLHARWGAIVGPRGLATLAILGNIFTTWSYFGTNQLGVGLHAYGGSERNTAWWLLTFAISQLLLASLGILPSLGAWLQRRRVHVIS